MHKVLKLQSVDSTHKYAVRLVENGKAEECIIIAEKQTDGVGRCGRIWESPSGNLYTSIIKKLPPDTELGKLSLTVAAAVHKVLSHYVPDNNLHLHWPNDVYYRRSKVAGILIAVLDHWMIISIGVNVNSAPDIVNAISIRDISGVEVISVEEVWRSILIELDIWLEAFCVSNFLFIKNYWLRYVNEINCKVIIKNGLDSITGIFKGIGDDGRLILGKQDKDLFISSGDMFLNVEGITVNYE
ncbi:MAG: biotin--[acetyl-CoA-carboxylase] ligase [Holosporaceae bacterium]|jgi:BirA family biotin operon repressor/biotin-[acetyl-CoA-carboxylase] ligase|nr:biotin--[acetyl-CoA-carboxylase] ligase [Holosporaceae bacterium]